MKKLIATLLLTLSDASWAGSAPVSPQVAAVVRLYQDFAWTALIDEPQTYAGFAEQRAPVLARYLTPRLVRLFTREQQCLRTTHELCRLDMDPIWASQDPAATAMTIVPGATPDLVEARYRYPSNGETIHLRFHMVRAGRRWLIDDIDYDAAPSLRTMLAGPL